MHLNIQEIYMPVKTNFENISNQNHCYKIENKQDSFEKQNCNRQNICEKNESLLKKSIEKMFKCLEENPASFCNKTEEIAYRKQLSEKQIEDKAKEIFNEAFDKLNIPQKFRPILDMDLKSDKAGGGYVPISHLIKVNKQLYREGFFELEDLIMHEATHAKAALLRAGIPKQRIREIVQNELLQNILNGEFNKIIINDDFENPIMMTPPAMSMEMKKDFARFAKENLYNDSNDFELDCEKINSLIEKYPEFISQYNNKDNAFIQLKNYSLSHHYRYKYYSNNSIKDKFGKEITITELNGKKLELAEKSLKNIIKTMEATLCLLGDDELYLFNHSVLNQYQFSPEEVLAQVNGNRFLIHKIQKEITVQKSLGKLSYDQEMYLNSKIETAKLTIKYKTKGLEYYKKYNQWLKNQSDENLKLKVNELKSELDKMLGVKINKYSADDLPDFIKKKLNIS